MSEPNPNKYNNANNYVDALSEYWNTYGGPSNRSRAIALRLQAWFNKEHAKKKLLASNARNLRREFKYISSSLAKFNNSNNNHIGSNSNSSMSRNAPSNRNMSAIKKIMKNLKTITDQHGNTSNKLNTIANMLVKNKNKVSSQKYKHVRNVMIPRTKAKIRAQNSMRAFEQVRNKLTKKLPMNLVSRILSSNVVPSGLMKIGKKVRTYWGSKTNLNIYKNKNDQYWFQNKQGRWYRMTSPNQTWYYHNMNMGWRPN
jgi:hypothetical protein